MHRHLGMAAVCTAAALLPIGAPGSLNAQFADTEVSGSGAPPFLLADDEWSFERLVGGVTYTIYESVEPRQGFAALVDGLVGPPGGPTATWTVDAGLLGTERLHFYLVTANDGSDDNSPGEGSEGTSRDVTIPGRCPGGGAPIGAPVPLELVRVGGFNQPMLAVHPPGDVDRLFVGERSGTVVIHRLSDGSRTTFLDISGAVSTGGERGLLGMDFHPDYPNDPRFFIYYSTRDPSACGGSFTDHCARLSSFEVLPADPDTADASSEVVMLEMDEPFGNHNGGWLELGPDGYLYLAFGDGGAGGDPLESGQDRTTMLGSILRLAVDGGDPNVAAPDCGLVGNYWVPTDNPFADGPGGDCDEIAFWGLRNAWRNGFDRRTGDLWIADVGQNQWEEVDLAPAGALGLNYGWDMYEASACFEPPCDPAGKEFPVVEYDHSEGCSITGGYMYRGCRMPFLDGTYFYGEFCSGWIRTFEWDGSAAVNQREPFPGGTVGNLNSFGESAAGELYVVSIGGDLYRIQPLVP